MFFLFNVLVYKSLVKVFFYFFKDNVFDILIFFFVCFDDFWFDGEYLNVLDIIFCGVCLFYLFVYEGFLYVVGNVFDCI